MLILLLAGRTA